MAIEATCPRPCRMPGGLRQAGGDRRRVWFEIKEAAGATEFLGYSTEASEARWCWPSLIRRRSG